MLNGALMFWSVVVCAVSMASAQSGGTFEVSRVVIAGGGATISGGPYSVVTTAGQPAVGASSGAGYSVSGGVTPADDGPTPGTPPATPVNLVAAATSMSSISLTWIDSSMNEDNFELERCEGKGRCRTFILIASPGQNTVSYTDGELSPGTQYSYRVRSVNQVGVSQYSNTAKARTPRR
jgi:hypothetical protein